MNAVHCAMSKASPFTPTVNADRNIAALPAAWSSGSMSVDP
jgi:hypothetical protein